MRQLADWMLANGFATGHGDTVDDLLRELTWQVGELREGRNMSKCTICGEPLPEGVPFKFHGWDGNDCPEPPTHKDVVVVESGIRQKRDGTIWFFVGNQEIECASMQEAEAMVSDLNAMVQQSGGSTHPPRAQ